MEIISGIFNESIDTQLPRSTYLCLGSSYEDRQADRVEGLEKQWGFFLDRFCRGRFMFIYTGNYIIDPHDDRHEKYDNYQNRLLVIEVRMWKRYRKAVLRWDKQIYDCYGTEFPVFRQNLLDQAEDTVFKKIKRFFKWVGWIFVETNITTLAARAIHDNWEQNRN